MALLSQMQIQGDRGHGQGNPEKQGGPAAATVFGPGTFARHVVKELPLQVPTGAIVLLLVELAGGQVGVQLLDLLAEDGQVELVLVDVLGLPAFGEQRG